MILFRASLLENFENLEKPPFAALELAELDAPVVDLEKSPLRAAKLLEGIFRLGHFDCDEFCEELLNAISGYIIPRTQIRKTAPTR